MQRTTRNDRRAGWARNRSPGGVARAFAIAAMVLSAAPALHAGTGLPAGDDTILVARRRGWWRDTWTHSMQEECFIAWMDGFLCTRVWRHSMQEREVEAFYAWWTANVWEPLVPEALD